MTPQPTPQSPRRRRRWYRALLRLLPSEVRGDFGQDMAETFEDERDDARHTGGRLGIVRTSARAVRDVVVMAPREHLDVLVRDVRYAVRLMRRTRGTTLAAMVTIALGVGTVTAMYSIVHGVLFGLPFSDPDRIVRVFEDATAGQPPPITAAQFEVWRAHQTDFEALAAQWAESPVLTGSGPASRLYLETVSASMFDVLGVAAARGRVFGSSDDRAGAPDTVIVSDEAWRRLFSRDPTIVGRVLTLDNRSVTVVGVMPPGFEGPLARSDIDGWTPYEAWLGRQDAARRVQATAVVFGKLRPGASATTVAGHLQAMWMPPAAGYTARRGLYAKTSWTALSPIADEILGDVRTPLWALGGAAVFVLLIACANVGGLLVGRSHTRRAELAMRSALGCSRARLVRQLLTESLVLAVAGGAGGLLLAVWGVRSFVALAPRFLPRMSHIAFDGHVLVACLGTSVVTSVLFGVLPALYASRRPTAEMVKAAGGTFARAGGLRGSLVVTEVTLSLALVVGAGLLVRTFVHLRPDHPGFDPGGKVATTITLSQKTYVDAHARETFDDALIARLTGTPGIAAITSASFLPLSGIASMALVGSQSGPRVSTWFATVSPNYFDQMHIRLVAGRSFLTTDSPAAPRVIVLGQRLSSILFGRRSPVGQVVNLWPDADDTVTPDAARVVGIADDVRTVGADLRPRSLAYTVSAQYPGSASSMVLSTNLPVDRVAAIVRQDVAALDPHVVVGRVEAMTDMVAQQVATWRVAATLMTMLAGIAAGLAALGLFAMVSWSVAERTREIGVRLALGATGADVMITVVRRALVLALLGVGGGLALASGTTRYLASWMVDITPLDLPSFAIGAAGMIVIAILAGGLPAWRATAVDPVTVLRSE